MSYFNDLTPYSYAGNNGGNVFNIGWLDNGCDFKKGELEEKFIKYLWEYVKYPINQTRGIFYNNYLDSQNNKFIASYEGYNILLGSAEIRVFDSVRNCVYASPNLIIHYILNHHYLPPARFIHAVMNEPKPDSDEYSKLIRSSFNTNYISYSRLKCNYCQSNKTELGFTKLKEFINTNKVQIIAVDKYTEDSPDRYMYDIICKDCGKKFTLPYEMI